MYLIFRQTHFRLTSLVTPCRLAIVQKEVNLWPTYIKERWPAKIRNPISRQVVMSFTSSSAMAITDGHHRAPFPEDPAMPRVVFLPWRQWKSCWDLPGTLELVIPCYSPYFPGPPGPPGPLVWEPSYEFLQILVGLMRVWRILIYMLTQNTFKNNNHNRLPYCYNVFLVIAVIIFYCIVLSASSCIIQLFIPMNM